MYEDEELRKEIQMSYIRVCRDSDWCMDYIQAAHFAAKLLKISALEIWISFGDLKLMESIAKGEHPAVNNPDYDNRRTPIKKET